MKRILNIMLPMFGASKLIKYVLLGIFSGAFSFIFINGVTRVIGLIIARKLDKIEFKYLAIFTLIILCFTLIRRGLSLAIIKLSQTLFWTLRDQVLTSLLKANYSSLISRKSKINVALSNDVYILTEAATSIILFFTSLIVGMACLIYLATISLILFLITVFVAATGIIIYQIGNAKNSEKFERSRTLETKFLEELDALLNGSKEIYVEPRKGNYIYENKIKKIASEAYGNNVAAYTGFLNNQITGQILFYFLITIIILVFSVTLNIIPKDIVSFVFTLLFLLNSIETIMVSLPSLFRAKVASNHLLDLNLELKDENRRADTEKSDFNLSSFDILQLNKIEYSYNTGSNKFAIGPINFFVEKGEIIFIYGGNGSGKTTFIHTLLGLRIPSAGSVVLNNVPVVANNYEYYRSNFAVVFSDFYLFKEIFDFGKFDSEKWNYYLELFGLSGKITLSDKTFSTTDLSTGQRKRLALIAALMEDKPILILDEWAADQDPYFRKKFYLELLPILKGKGLTIIALTHDDKYYSCADRVFKMEDGQLNEESTYPFSVDSRLKN